MIYDENFGNLAKSKETCNFNPHETPKGFKTMNFDCAQNLCQNLFFASIPTYIFQSAHMLKTLLIKVKKNQT